MEVETKEKLKKLVDMDEKPLKYKMYEIVIYNISGMQAGIQGSHAKDQFEIKYGHTPEYKEWLHNCKTVIVLDGGTTNDGIHSCYGETPEIGTMQEHISALRLKDIPHAFFKEPDLNNAMTAIAFIADERVFNNVDYPRYIDFCRTKMEDWEFEYAFKSGNYDIYEVQSRFAILTSQWQSLVGGYKNGFLKEWLPEFRLARN
jgi:hypothetical protein